MLIRMKVSGTHNGWGTAYKPYFVHESGKEESILSKDLCHPTDNSCAEATENTKEFLAAMLEVSAGLESGESLEIEWEGYDD